MKTVLVPLATGFEEIETVTVVDILRRGGARVTVAGMEEGQIKGSRSMRVVPDALFEDVKNQDFDMLVLPGGQPGTDNLNTNENLLNLVRSMHAKEKYIAAICAAPLVLQTAGILDDVEFTSHPSVQERLTAGKYSEDRVSQDGKVITSRSPGTAMEFALKLVDILFGPEMVEKINNGVMAKI